jgi:AraC family L-rhamnose operon transcriptional activator RhaR/AraC family L-rhamnose operon regulatory protein RhaS
MTSRYKYSDFVLSPNFRFHIHTVKLDHAAFEMHSHEFSELVIVLDGCGVHITEVEKYPICAGDVFVLNGDMFHGFEDAYGINLCNIMYDPAQFLDEREDITQLAGYHALFVLEPLYRRFSEFQSRLRLNQEQLITVSEVIRELKTEHDQRPLGHQTQIRSLFTLLIVYLSRCYQDYGSSDHTWQLAAVMNYLNENFTRPIHMKELARLAHMSTSHFTRIFRCTFHTSPIDYLIRLRLRKACELMREEHYSLTQIAHDVGFSDSNYFSRQFKRIIGKTPSQYRRELRKLV